MSRARALGVAALAGLALAGCAAVTPRPVVAPVAQAPPPPEPPRVVRVYVPKPVKCVPEDLGPPPSYPDSDAALRDAGGAADRYQLLAAGRILREQRLARLEEVIRRCRTAAAR
jgi:hypothetical protein